MKTRPPAGTYLPKNILALDVTSILNGDTQNATATQLSQELDDALSTLPIDVPPPRVSFASVGDEPSVESDDETVDPTLNCHGIQWAKDDDAVIIDCNGQYMYRQWQCRDVMGNHCTTKSDPTQMSSRLEYFMMMFPNSAMQNIITLTNDGICKKKKQLVDYDELICFFGIIVLGTRFEFPGQLSRVRVMRLLSRAV
eukprot:scaffold8943_cov213-Amphora_coffeaeformis.AAC.4